ncbi:MAG: diaminopimelate decarboxylase [Deltaproteobacteria bacterium]|nr:diaminopimelate decarboxylase [Deltaproteobacteria bacterium]
MTKCNQFEFEYRQNHLFCEDCRVDEIIKKHGTPLYVYSRSNIVEQFKQMTRAFGTHTHVVCYSVKANSNGAILKTLVNLGAGMDVVSGGELRRALNVGCDPKKIVYSGVGKTANEIRFAIQTGILQINCESEQELSTIQNIASSLNIKAPVALRVNPDIDPKTHPYISTGLKENKFGISHLKAVSVYKSALSMSHIEITGISCHIGSQILECEPFRNAMIKLKDIINQLAAINIPVKNVDVGGGLGIIYNNENPLTATDYARAITEPLTGLDCTILLEPGRFIVGNAGILVTKVIYVKEGDHKEHFTIVDAAFNDLKRPMLYGAYHEIIPVMVSPEKKTITTNIEGPICETTDRFARHREMQPTEPGEYLAIMSTGAYGMSMACTYNSRGRPAEVLVKGDQFFLVRKADSIEDITHNEIMPGFLT